MATDRTFPEVLREDRQKLGLSATQLAARIGASESLIYKWEGGRAQPSLRHLQGLAAVFGWPLPWGTEEAAS